MDLDLEFGECRGPLEIHPHEGRKQASWLLLDDAGGRRLKQHLDHACTDAYLATHFCDGFNTLWLVDKAGEIRVAIEEMAIQENPTFISVPMPINFRNNRAKLGHPSLVEGGPARIGGEISLNPTTGECHLSNKSGRFGFNRTREQLEHAAARFRKYGIPVEISYLSGRL